VNRARKFTPVGMRVTSSPDSASSIRMFFGMVASRITAAVTPILSNIGNTFGPSWMP